VAKDRLRAAPETHSGPSTSGAAAPLRARPTERCSTSNASRNRRRWRTVTWSACRTRCCAFTVTTAWICCCPTRSTSAGQSRSNIGRRCRWAWPNWTPRRPV